MNREFTFVTSGEEKKAALPQADINKLIEIQTAQLRATYDVDCLDAQQLQKVFNISQSSAYKWLNDCKEVRKVCGRKVVPVVWVAYYLVTGKDIQGGIKNGREKKS